jgi:hypothetical protein
VINARWRRWSPTRRRKVAAFAAVITVPLCVCLPTVLFGLLAFTRPPSWVTNVREYQINGRLGLMLLLLEMAVLGVTILLGIAASLSGASAAGGGAESLRARLGIVRKRFRSYVAATILLRLAVVGLFALAGVYAYSRVLGPRLNTGLPGSTRELIGPDPIGWGLAILVLIPWIIGPALRVRISAAAGALAATFTHGRIQRTSYALGARFGLGFMAVLGGLWLFSGVALLIQTIVDPVSTNMSYQTPVLPLELLRLPLTLIVTAVFGYSYTAGQLLFAEIFTRLAQRRVKAERKTAGQS